MWGAAVGQNMATLLPLRRGLQVDGKPRSAAAGDRPKRLVGRFPVAAVEHDSSTSLVDALLAHCKWAKELDAEGIAALRGREAALQAEELDLRAHKMYHSAYTRVTHARKQAAGQGALHGAFMVAAVQRDPNTTLLDALLAESAVAKGLASEDMQALRKYEADLQGDVSLHPRKRARLLYFSAVQRSDKSQRRRAGSEL